MIAYQLKHGDHEKQVCQQWARGDFGPMPMPEFLRNKPRVPEWAALYLDAYYDLSGDRGAMGEGRIPWTACHMWARAHGLNSRQEADLVYYVRRMDTAFMSHTKK